MNSPCCHRKLMMINGGGGQCPKCKKVWGEAAIKEYNPKTNCGVGSITFGGVHHVLIQAVFEDRKPTTTVCGTDAPAHRDLFDDEWGFEDVCKAMEAAERCARPCRRCRKSVAIAKAVARNMRDMKEVSDGF